MEELESSFIFCPGLRRNSLIIFIICLKLEELSLEYNCIRRLDGISHLVKLRRLSVGHNFISSVEPSILDRLGQLQFISIEDNRVSTLSSLANINSLTELYAGNNLIENMREIFFLKVRWTRFQPDVWDICL